MDCPRKIQYTLSFHSVIRKALREPMSVLSIKKCGKNECREGVKRTKHWLRTISMAPDCKRFIALFIAAYSTACLLPVYSLYYEMMRKFWAACRLQRTGDIKRLTAIFTILYSHIVPEGMYAFRGMTSDLHVRDKKRHVYRLLFDYNCCADRDFWV